MPDTPDDKACSACGERKPAAEFYRSSLSRNGLRTQCKVCNKAKRRTEALIHLPVTEQRCNACGNVKPAAEFARDLRLRTGLNSRCKQCFAAYQRAAKVERLQQLKEARLAKVGAQFLHILQHTCVCRLLSAILHMLTTPWHLHQAS